MMEDSSERPQESSISWMAARRAARFCGSVHSSSGQELA